MDKPNYYAIIPANVRYDNELKPNEKLLYGEICALTNENGCCWATNDYFAQLYDASKETISRWIKHLAEKQYIKIKYFYKESTKQIDKRIITINNNDDFINNVLTKKSIESPQKNQGSIDKKVKENNTSINNIYICPSNDEQASSFPLKEDNEEELSNNFDLIWTLYPRKEGKNTAFRHYKSWLKGKKYAGKKIKLTNKQMWYATKKYADLVEKEKIDKQFIKMGSTFFNEAIIEYVEEDNKDEI